MCMMPTPVYLVEDDSRMPPPPLTANDVTELFRDANMAADDSSISSEEGEIVAPPPPNRRLFEPNPAMRFHYDIDEDSEEESEEEMEDDDVPPPPPQEDTSSYNALFLLLGNLKATMRFMRVDIENLPHHNRVVSMRVRLENMEAMIDGFEDQVIRNGIRR